MPGKPTMALASMGIYVFDTAFLFEQLRRDAADPNSSHDFGKDIIPYIVKHGSAVAHHFSRSCVRTSGQAALLLARRRHARRLLGGQHRPDRRRAAARSLRPQLADLDLCRDLAAGEIRARPGWAARPGGLLAGLRRLHHFRRHRSGSRCCSPTSICIPTREVENAVVLPEVEIGRGVRLKNVIVDRGVRIPDGLVVGEDPELDAARFRRTESGICLITQADDRQIGRMTALNVLAVTSEIYPFVKTGGLADVAGALPLALAPARRRRRRRWCRAIPRSWRRSPAPTGSSASTICSAAPRRSCTRAAPGSIFSCSTRRICSTGPAIRISAPDGRDWPDNAFRFGALSCVAARIALGDVAGLRARHRAWPRLAGRPRHGLPRLSRAAAAGDRADRPQSRLPGTIPGRPARRAAAAAACVRNRRRRELRHDRLSQGRPAIRRPHHHGVADLRAGNPDARRTAAASTGCCGARSAVLERHPQRHRHRRLESGDRPADRRQLRPADRLRRGRRTRPRCSSASALRRCRTRCCSP